MENLPTEAELVALELIYTSDLRDVVEGICGIYRVTPEQIVSRMSSRRLTETRQVLSYILKSVFGKTTRETGAFTNRSMEAAKKYCQDGKRVVNSCNELVKELVAIIQANETYRKKQNAA